MQSLFMFAVILVQDVDMYVRDFSLGFVQGLMGYDYENDDDDDDD